VFCVAVGDVIVEKAEFALVSRLAGQIISTMWWVTDELLLVIVASY